MASELSFLKYKMDDSLKMQYSNKRQENMKRVYLADWEFPHQSKTEFVSEEFSEDAPKLEKFTDSGMKSESLLRTKDRSIKADNNNLSIIRSDSLRTDVCTPSTTACYNSTNLSGLMRPCKGPDDPLKYSSLGIIDLTKSRNGGINEMNFNLNKPFTRRALKFAENHDGDEHENRFHHLNAVSLLREYADNFDSEGKYCQISHNSLISTTDASCLGNACLGVDERPYNATEIIELECCCSASRQRSFDGNVHKNSIGLPADSTCVKLENCKTASLNGRTAINELQALADSGNADKLVRLNSVRRKVKRGKLFDYHFGDSRKALGAASISCSSSIKQSKKLFYKDRNKSMIQSTVLTKNRLESDFSAECSVEKDVSTGQRSDISFETTLADNKFADSAMTMKHLIAAAQAKRRQAHSHQFLDENSVLKDKIWLQSSVPSDPMPLGLFLPVKQGEHADYDHMPNEEKRQCIDSLNSNTESAVARGALEGMIETLSRTRDSIGRATRQAINCAKYGMTNEVVDLLIRKLEDEPSLSRRIDLFFLVDSITQCSHTHKGIIGAPYVPVVQSALTRLLDAAAPSGSPAHENRRQCLKVLRLWLERRIMPEKFLLRHMNDLKVRNDGLKPVLFGKIQSCGQLSEDGSMREMENFPFDQYGSNTTFLVPGVFSANQFDSGEVISNSPLNAATDNSSEIHTRNAHLCALNHLENEIEMEDALSVSPDPTYVEGCSSFSYASHQNELLLIPDCFPPLPLGLPPTTPPLPLSPPPPTPPPPPPSSPSPQSSPLSPLITTNISHSSVQLQSSLYPSGCRSSLGHENVNQSLQPNGEIAFKILAPGVNNEVPQILNLMQQVSQSGHLFGQCNEVVQRTMPSQFTLPALKILNHSLSDSQMSSDHSSHSKSMRLRHLLRKYGAHTSINPLHQRKYGVKNQWMPHHNNIYQDYPNSQNLKERTSSSSAPLAQDGYCRLKIERPHTSFDFHHLHYSAPRASLPGGGFPKWHRSDISRPT